MILLIGFPKSGTTSFNVLFKKLGYKSVHWKINDKYIGTIIKKNKKNKKPLLYGFRKINCITQMDVCICHHHAYWPQIIDYKQLYFENRNSIIILNKRDPKKLLSSFKRWGELDKRLYKYNHELIKDKSDKGFVNFVKKHYNEVEEFFKQHPDAKFISFDIEKDKLEKLSKYINLKGIKILPKHNVNTIKN